MVKKIRKIKHNIGMHEAIKLEGTQLKLAKLLGVKQACINRWLWGLPPLKRAMQINFYYPVIELHDLRPDMFNAKNVFRRL